MNSSEKKQIHRALWAVMAGALALSLAACEQEPSAGKLGRNIDRGAGQAGRQPDQVADAAKKIDEAGQMIGEKSAKGGKAIDDMALTAKVKSALLSEPGLKALAFDVNTSGGVVTLYGTVDTPETRDMAVQVASSVEGVRAVKNNLVVIKGS